MLYGDFDGNGADEEETYTVAVAGDTLDLSARVGFVIRDLFVYNL